MNLQSQIQGSTAVLDQPITEVQCYDLLAALKASTLTSPHPLVTALKAQGNRTAIADFAWALFWSWHHGEGDSKDSWVMRGLGLWGDDTTVFKLMPLLSRRKRRSEVKLRGSLGILELLDVVH
jgi:hypothetical protein